MNRIKQNPGKKARPGSPFHFFLMDRLENLARQGVKVDSRKEFEDETFCAWKKLYVTEPEKLKKYFDKHSEWEMKNNSSKLRNKYDQSGRSLEKIKHEDQMKKDEKMEQQKFVETTVKDLASKGKLTEEGFFIVHFNTTTPEGGTQEGKHYPCEIGLVKYSIKNGVEKIFHMFISPTQIPFGYHFEVLKKSKETHNIPPDPNEFTKYEKNYNHIFTSIQDFMANDNFEETIRPVYVMAKHEDAAKYIFKLICEKAGQSEETFKVCQLPHLLFELMKVAPGEKTSIDSVAVATKYLDRETFKYSPELGCNFHEELGVNTHHCALTIATCLGFNMAEMCSKPFNVLLQPGRHTPSENSARSSAPSRVSTEIVKQAVTQETRNSWGTKISVQAAPAGISPIPTDFHPNQVTLGPEAQLFPGLHPDLDERRSQVEDFSQRSEFSHRESESLVQSEDSRQDSIFQSDDSHRGSIFQSEDSHRESFLNSSCDDLGSVKSVNSSRPTSSVASVVKVGGSPLMEQISQNMGMLKLASSAHSNNQTQHMGMLKLASSAHSNNQTKNDVANGWSSIHGRGVVDGARPIPEREKVKENRKVKNEGIQSCQVGQKSAKGNERAGMKCQVGQKSAKGNESAGMKCQVGQKSAKGNERAGMKFKIQIIKKEKDVNTDMNNERSDNVDCLVLKDLKDNDSHDIKMDNKTEHVERQERSSEVPVESSRAHFSQDENVSILMVEKKYAKTGGEKENESFFERGSRGLNDADALNSTVGNCEKIEKIVQNIGGVGRQRGRGRGLSCLGNSANSTVGKSALKISGKENKPTVENHSILTGIDDAVNSTVGKISGAGRGRGNGKIILKGSVTDRK